MAFAKLSSATWANLGPVAAVGNPAAGHLPAAHLAVERTGATTSPRDGNPAKVSSNGTSPAPDKPEPRHLAGPSVPGP